MSKVGRFYERRYHATWLTKNGRSDLAMFARWMCDQKEGQRGVSIDLTKAPRDLLQRALADVAARLPQIATREPTRRHRKHFAWLLGWRLRLLGALRKAAPPGQRRLVDTASIMVAADELERCGDLATSTRLRLALPPKDDEHPVVLGERQAR
jgi:hypothetical protein